jgi:iron complex transport system substrate-binding protein
MKHVYTLLLGLCLALSTATAQAQETSTCVETYDPQTDYFPNKAEFVDSQNVTVAYHNHYKVVTVRDAFDEAPLFNYVLVQCGTPAPPAEDFAPETQFVEVPIDRIITLTTTQLPHLLELDRLDALVGIETARFVNTPAVRDMIESGALVQVGSGVDINVEMVLDAEPDIVMTHGYNPATDSHPVLREAGVFTALNASWREPTPLARAEWLKYTALFFNEEEKATNRYDAIKADYEATRDLAADVPEDERPVVLRNYFSPYSDSWTIVGAETYAGALIRDAGGIIALGDEAPTDSTDASFEFVYGNATDADIWLPNAFGVTSLSELLEQDERYIDFEAAQEGNVWNNNADVNENGGNNYFELGVTNPHLILRDLVAIFHPELLPDHDPTFYHRLTLED